MSVEDWARAEAEKKASEMPREASWGALPYKLGFIEGVSALAERLQSPEAIEAAAKAAWVSGQSDQQWAARVVDDVFSPTDDWPQEALEAEATARAVLAAALDAIPKGDE